MAYTKFQFVAYQVPTAGVTLTDTLTGKPVTIYFGPYPDCAPVAGITAMKDPELSIDAQIRLRRFAAVVNKAFLDPHVVHRADTLIVFVAPEFYFRPSDPENNHSYSEEEGNAIKSVLGQMFVHEKYKDWLIIPGTIISSVVKRGNPLLPGRRYYKNTTIVIKGNKKGSLATIEKQQPSDKDGVPILNGITFERVFKDGDYRAYYHMWSERRQRLFMSDGVRFCLDICLDHLGLQYESKIPEDRCRLAKHVLHEAVGRNEVTDVSLHILTAGGMVVQPESVAAKAGGYILRTDGQPFMPDYTNLFKVERYTKRGRLVTSPDDLDPCEPESFLEGDREFFKFPNCAKAVFGTTPLVPVNRISLRDELVIQPTVVRMDQEVVIYPVCDLPC